MRVQRSGATPRRLRSLSNEHTLQAAEAFAQFTAPVLIAWGAQDRLFPRSLAQRLAAAFPDSRLEIIEGALTFVAEDEPARLAELIGDFVAPCDSTATLQEVPAR